MCNSVGRSVGRRGFHEVFFPTQVDAEERADLCEGHPGPGLQALGLHLLRGSQADQSGHPAQDHSVQRLPAFALIQTQTESRSQEGPRA